MVRTRGVRWPENCIYVYIMFMQQRIPFKVSARTARLIGRENVATSKGAIIELVKNSYDADSAVCSIYIDNSLAVFRPIINLQVFNLLLGVGVPENILKGVYSKAGDGYYKVQSDVDKHIMVEFLTFLKRQASIYIVDSGEGMTEQIIRDNWMTIGTDNKSSNFRTRNGRIKAGAKGIGRFALDKLGSRCEMITFFDKTVHIDNSGNIGYRWNVNWSEFETESRTIDTITAELSGLQNTSLQNELIEYDLPSAVLVPFKGKSFEHGTILKISDLRDMWDEELVSQLYDDLGLLVPPVEDHDFTISLRESLEPANYGVIESIICDDYDYKLVAHADTEQNVQIKIFRQEQNIEIISPSFFEREHQQHYPYRKEDFVAGCWECQRTFSQLIPGYESVDYRDTLSRIGSFDFTFYYLKRSSNSIDDKRFCYRTCAYGLRKNWLDKFGGIKLFRDNFRVRPYGEKGGSAFDWLGLGARKIKSPAGIAKKNGGYRVEVENVAGSIRISRLTNIEFDDKSSREGLQENLTLSLFKNILNGIINVFEEDRSAIARELSADDDQRNGADNQRRQAEELAKRIYDQGKTQDVEGLNSPDTANLRLLASLNKQKDEEIEQLREEQKVLRALASSGLMLASFSHDLSKINDSITGRYDKIRKAFLSRIDINLFSDVSNGKNPFVLLERANKTDKKMQDWLRFSTGIIRKDKRKRRDILLPAYFDELSSTWSSVFEVRGIVPDFSRVQDIKLRAFEIDLDSIFYNLFSNSIEAFIIQKEDRARSISVSFYETDNSLVCEYKDSGPGLSPDIVNPTDIFKPLFTTKRNNTNGEETGTGLGMWIVNLIAQDNDAKIQLLTPEYGFGVQFKFPIKYKK